LRISLDEYRKNIERIIKICIKNNIRIVLIKMPVNLSLPLLSNEETEAVRDGSDLSHYYYSKGEMHERKGKYADARVYFEKAKNYQVLDCSRRVTSYQQVMEDMGRIYKLPVIDADHLFRDAGDYQSLFNGREDPIHPNSLGHKIIAEALFDVILKNDYIQ